MPPQAKRKASGDDGHSTIEVGSRGLQVRPSRNANTTVDPNSNQQQEPDNAVKNSRPIRSNRGQGGHLAGVKNYVTAAAQKQFETSNKSSSGTNRTRDMPEDLAENPNAPPLKKARTAKKLVRYNIQFLSSKHN